MCMSATARGKESTGEKGFPGAFLSNRITGGCVDEEGIRGIGSRGAVACIDSDARTGCGCNGNGVTGICTDDESDAAEGRVVTLIIPTGGGGGGKGDNGDCADREYDDCEDGETVGRASPLRAAINAATLG